VPPRKRLSRAEQQAQTKARLLAAAERLHAEHGLAALTVEEVAEAAGYSRGAVYSNFTSRDDLVMTLFEQRAERQLEAMAGDDPVLMAADRDSLAMLVEFWAFAASRPEMRERFAIIRRRQRALLEAMTSDAALAAGLLALTTGLLLEGLVDDEFDAVAVHAAMVAKLYRA
jgi:AcrR family transcriptional regulator